MPGAKFYILKREYGRKVNKRFVYILNHYIS